MILRHITQHVKDQNWFAVGIDFFIVVVGILIAFQITNWSEQRQAYTELEIAEAALQFDLMRNYVNAKERLTLQECRVAQFQNLSEKLLAPGDSWQGVARLDTDSDGQRAIKNVLRSPSRVWGSRIWHAELNRGTFNLMGKEQRNALDLLFGQVERIQQRQESIIRLQSRLNVLGKDTILPRSARLRYFDILSEIDTLSYFIERNAEQVIQSIETIGVVLDTSTKPMVRSYTADLNESRPETYGSCVKPITLEILDLTPSENES